jgi:glycosyltransferase involved in cell wall biosynthesis
MKILHVTTVPITLFFFSGHFAFLRHNGVELGLVSSPDPALEQVATQAQATAFPVAMARQPAPLQDLRSLAALTAIFRRERPDIIHATTPKAGLLAPLAARLAGVRGVVLSMFGLAQMTKTGPMKHLLNATSRLSCALADRVWCDSVSMREHVIAERLCPRGKVTVLGQGSVNGIDAGHAFNPAEYLPNARRDIRARYRIPENALVTGFVGRLVKDKGINELTAAWNTLRTEFPQAHLLLIGPFEPQDPVTPATEQTLKNDARIHLAGWRRDIPAHLAAMDLFVNPSYREGFGVANLEASAMGLPVLSTAIPGCVDSVQDGTTGSLVPPRCATSLEAAWREYLNNAELRHRHGTAGRERVLRDFRPETLNTALFQLYQKMYRRGHR